VLRLEESSWVDRFKAVPELDKYVVRERIPRLRGEQASDAILTNLRPLSLNYWLSRRNDPVAPPEGLCGGGRNGTDAGGCLLGERA
jgi:hypothetical protein